MTDLQLPRRDAHDALNDAHHGGTGFYQIAATGRQLAPTFCATAPSRLCLPVSAAAAPLSPIQANAVIAGPHGHGCAGFQTPSPAGGGIGLCQLHVFNVLGAIVLWGVARVVLF